MRALLIGLLVIGLLVPVLALRPQADEPPASGLDAARAVLEASREAYRAAPALLDTMVMTYTAPRRGAPETVELEIGGADEVRMTVRGMVITAVDGYVYIDKTDVPEKYLRVGPNDGAARGMIETFGQIFGPRASVPLQIAMRADLDEAGLLQTLVMGALRQPRLAGYERGEGEDGRPLHRIRIEDDGGPGHVELVIDGASGFVTSLNVEVMPPDPRQSLPIKREVIFDTRVVDGLPAPVTFAAAGRTAVSDFSELKATPAAVGQMAPDFTLATLDGEQVTLSDLRGSVVVLDFWATWCGPCRQGLPMLSKFNEWVNETGQPVKVYAIDTWERVDVERQKIAVNAYWSSQGFSMPTLMDHDSAVVGAYGVRGIPATIVIDADGRIANIHNGVLPGMVDELKRDVGKVLPGSS